MTSVLKQIIDSKKESIKKFKAQLSIQQLEKKISSYNNYLDFKAKLTQKKISVIAEIKKASPSAGMIVDNYAPVLIAKNYLKSGASCLSILTEEKYFHGQLEHITQVKKEVKLPVLCKDFFIDAYQVYLAKSFGADAILIILSAVENSVAKEIYDTANSLNIATIIEVHTIEEAKNALNFENAIVGINNRNLETLNVDISNTYKLHKILLNHTGPLICESGIKTEKDVEEIVKKTKINNFLIGESLLKDLDKNSSLLKNITQIRA